MSSERFRLNSIVSTGHFRRTAERQTATSAKPTWPPTAPQAVPQPRVLRSAPRAAALVFRVPSFLGIAFVYAYRYTLGVLFPGGCKYHPSCSQYAIDALRQYGLVRGVILAGWRLLRCNPWSLGGVDYVEQQRIFR